ncbi:MAG: AAA family ATPase [Methylococcaceae bacterium]
MATHYLFVMGAESGVGKSTVCEGILALLLAEGYAPEQLAYIKPVTQCIAKQPVAAFCEQANITYRDIGSLVFQKGFSRDFIDGLTPNSSELLDEALTTILAVGKDKKMVIIDGVGDPSAGSVVGVSNVNIALSLPCKVIFVGKPGIGAAIDNTVLCVSFMQAKGLKDIGIIYNNISLETLSDMTSYVTKRLPECLSDITLLGFVPRQPQLHQGSVGQWFAAWLDVNVLFNWLDCSLR